MDYFLPDPETSPHEIAGRRVTFDDKYVTKSIIGSGSFGTVFLCRKKYRLKQLAVKVIRKSEEYLHCMDPKNDKQLMEVTCLQKLTHKNIVHLRKVRHTVQHIVIEMEYIANGMTLQLFVDMKIRIKNTVTAYIFYQLLDAVTYMHDEGIAHMDLQPRNIYITNKAKIKLLDFGSAHYLDTPVTGPRGTGIYKPPEAFVVDSYAAGPADSWALGVILFFVMTSERPLIAESGVGNRSHDFIDLDSIPVVSSLIQMEPKHRATPKQAKAMGWLTIAKKPSSRLFRNN